MRITALIAAGLLIATPAIAADKRTARGEAALAKILAGRTAGTPQRCLDLQRIQGSEIYEGTAIVYRTSRDTIWVNRTTGAQMLHDDDIPVTRVFGSQICRLDQLRLLDRLTRMQSGFAVLDNFVPYTKADRNVRRRP